MRLFRYGNVFAQASFQFCRHMDEYLVADTRYFGLVYFQTRFGRGGHMFRRYEDGRLVEERRLGFASSRRGSRAASSSTFPYGLYRQKEYLPLLTTTGRAGRAPEKRNGLVGCAALPLAHQPM